jgi:ATP-dependent protease Clp ATPase subunit
MTPAEIKILLDKEIIGQNSAKQVISTAIYIHLLRNKLLPNIPEHLHLPRPNILMMGNAGTGKTMLLQHVCKQFQLPHVHIDSSMFLTSNNIGELLDAYLRYLVLQFGPEKASTALICIENFDTLVDKHNGLGPQAISIQQDLLQLLEQPERLLVLEKNKEPIMFPLHKLILVFSGRFTQLAPTIYVRTRVQNKTDAILLKKETRLQAIEKYKTYQTAQSGKNAKPASIGFNKYADNVAATSEEQQALNLINEMYDDLKEKEMETLVNQAFQNEIIEEMQKDLPNTQNIFEQATYEDLISIGTIPELAGRFSFFAPFHSLSVPEVIALLKQPQHNILDIYAQYFSLDKDKLIIKEEVYELIAQEVVRRNIGTRSINAIVVKLLQSILFASPNNLQEQYVLDAAAFTKAMQ